MNRRKFKKFLRKNYEDMMYSYTYTISSIKFKKWIEGGGRLYISDNNIRRRLKCIPTYRMVIKRS